MPTIEKRVAELEASRRRTRIVEGLIAGVGLLFAAITAFLAVAAYLEAHRETLGDELNSICNDHYNAMEDSSDLAVEARAAERLELAEDTLERLEAVEPDAYSERILNRYIRLKRALRDVREEIRNVVRAPRPSPAAALGPLLDKLTKLQLRAKKKAEVLGSSAGAAACGRGMAALE